MFSRTSATRRVVAIVVAFLLLIALFFLRSPVSQSQSPTPPQPTIVYKAPPSPNAPVDDNFPLASYARNVSDLPPVPSFNQQWTPADERPAPLMIGFTRNWLLLQQCVLSYIAAGWPADSIYVIDNTGTMNSNRLGKLTLQNPFYLDYERLTNVFGVNVLTTPTLQTFAQLQNFMMFTAAEQGWDTYFWSHMDVAVLSDETFNTNDEPNPPGGQYHNLFTRATQRRAELIIRESNEQHKWAAHWFSYDHLTLVNLKAYMDVGGWDPLIGYYLSDCDFHERLFMAGWKIEDGAIALVANVASSLPDLGVFLRRNGWPGHGSAGFGTEAERGDESYFRLRDSLIDLQNHKNSDPPGGSNYWQRVQQGGQGEPFYRDAEGFDAGIWWHIALGRKIFAEKWGHRDCNLIEQGLRPHDAWRVEHNGDWSVTVE